MGSGKAKGKRGRGGKPNPATRVADRIRRSAHVRDTDGLDRIRPILGVPELCETSQQHRGLLLYAMQDEPERSLRTAAVAMEVTDGAIRNWAYKWDWTGRIDREGSMAQARACQLYRELYLQQDGLSRISRVERRMSVPFLTTSPVPFRTASGEPAVGDATRAVDLAGGGRPPDDEDRRVRKPEPPRDEAPAREPVPRESPAQARQPPPTTVVLSKIRLGLEAAIGGYIQRLSTPKGREELAREMRPSDFVKLVGEYQKLSGVLGIDTAGVSAAPGVAALEPTYRVQLAVLNGTSVEDAMLEDAEELVVIHRALRERRRVAEAVEDEARATHETRDRIRIIPGGGGAA